MSQVPVNATSRDILQAFHGEHHDGHSVAGARHRPDHVTLVCSCGAELGISEPAAKANGTTTARLWSRLKDFQRGWSSMQTLVQS